MLRRLPRRTVRSTLSVLVPALALAAGVVVVSPSAPASAVVPWNPSTPLAGTARAVGLVVDPDGGSQAVFDRGDGVFYRAADADGTRSPRVRLSQSGRTAQYGSLTRLDDTRVLAVWTERRPRGDSIIVSRVVTDGVPGARVVVAVGPIGEIGPLLRRARVAVVPGATADADPARVLVTWIDHNNGGLFYLSARDLDPATGAVLGDRQFPLAQDFVMEDSYALAADPASGGISAVWAADDDDFPTGLNVVTLPAGSDDAGDPVAVATTPAGDDPDLLVAPDGTLVVGWTDAADAGTDGAAHLATVDPGTAAVLDQATVSGPASTGAHDLDVVLDSQGTLTAGWGSGEQDVEVARVALGAGGTLTPQGTSTVVGTGGAPRLVVDTADQVSVLFAEPSGAGRPVVVRLAADGTPGGARYLLPFRAADQTRAASDDHPRDLTLEVGTDEQGRVHALWAARQFGLQLSVSDLPDAAPASAGTYLRRTPPATTGKKKARFLVGTDALDATFTYQLDGGPALVSTTRQIKLTGLAPGRHRITISAVDDDGTPPDPTPAQYQWRVRP